MNRPSLSALKLDVARADLSYVAVFIDLYKHGVIPKEKAEEIVGFDISDSLPGSSFAAKYKALKELRAKAASKAAAKPAPKAATKPAPEKDPAKETDNGKDD